MMQPGSRKRAATQALVLLALPALAAAFAPTGFFSKVVGVKNSPGTPSLRPRARLAAPLSARSGASRLVCSNDGREAVKHADHQYLVERGACGVGFIASKKNEASHDIIAKVRKARRSAGFGISAAAAPILLVDTPGIVCGCWEMLTRPHGRRPPPSAAWSTVEHAAATTTGGEAHRLILCFSAPIRSAHIRARE
jgi:hypothetical protein